MKVKSKLLLFTDQSLGDAEPSMLSEALKAHKTLRYLNLRSWFSNYTDFESQLWTTELPDKHRQ